MTKPSLDGRRMLVVEDDYIIAQDMRGSLEQEGAVVVGPAGSTAGALRLIEADPDLHAAIIDVNLNGEKSFAIAAALQRRRIPFVFTTGYGADDIPAD